jgi:uncharacterized protein (DUF2147 family)
MRHLSDPGLVTAADRGSIAPKLRARRNGCNVVSDGEPPFAALAVIMRVSLAIALALLIAAAAAAAQTSTRLEGTWLTADGTAKIRFETGSAALCGRIVWLRDPYDPQTGKEVVDKNNPDPALRTRRLLGIPLITDITPVRPGEWRANAYNAEDSETYEITLKLTAPNQLALRGCGLAGLICKTEYWIRSGS